LYDHRKTATNWANSCLLTPRVVPQPRPDPLQGGVVHRTDPVSVFVPRPLAGEVAKRRAAEAQPIEVAAGRTVLVYTIARRRAIWPTHRPMAPAA
jgi:hypothetical protein